MRHPSVALCAFLVVLPLTAVCTNAHADPDRETPATEAMTLPDPLAAEGNGFYQQSIGGGVVGFGRNIFDDLSLQFRSPFRYAKQNPYKFAAGTVGLLALIATDHHTHAALVDRTDGSVRTAAQRLSDAGRGTTALYFIAGLGAVGVITESRRELATSVMLVEALLTSSVWTNTLKTLSGRERPREREEIQSEWEGPAVFSEEQRTMSSLRSFPSGHTTGAFATATILAHQYPAYGIVPVLAYGSATAMGYSRMVVGAHWLSDVVVGALIGYGSARAVVGNRERRAEAAQPASDLHMGIDVSPSYRGVYLNYDF